MSRGGARPGAGRKKKEPTVVIRVPVSLVDDIRALISSHIDSVKRSESLSCDIPTIERAERVLVCDSHIEPVSRLEESSPISDPKKFLSCFGSSTFRPQRKRKKSSKKK